MLPGGTSHNMQALALARTLRGRGWRTAALLADFDVAGLQQKGLLDRELEMVVYSTPRNSHEEFEASAMPLPSAPCHSPVRC